MFQEEEDLKRSIVLMHVVCGRIARERTKAQCGKHERHDGQSKKPEVAITRPFQPDDKTVPKRVPEGVPGMKKPP